jgi:hypothetical protein
LDLLHDSTSSLRRVASESDATPNRSLTVLPTGAVGGHGIASTIRALEPLCGQEERVRALYPTAVGARDRLCAPCWGWNLRVGKRSPNTMIGVEGWGSGCGLGLRDLPFREKHARSDAEAA